MNGKVGKLENSRCRDILNKYDVIAISEIKTAYPINIDGYMCVRSELIDGEETRGGVCVFFKNKLWRQIYDIIRRKDQIWFNITGIDQILFRAVYIPPNESPYFSP